MLKSQSLAGLLHHLQVCPDPELIDPDNTESYEGTQQSYGMWFGAPDINSLVLVAFADGNRKHGYIISQVMQPQFNHMVPGIPAGKSFQGGKFLTPVAEKNKYSEQEGHNDIIRPIHHDLAEAITKQGLINDKIREPVQQVQEEIHQPSIWYIDKRFQRNRR